MNETSKGKYNLTRTDSGLWEAELEGCITTHRNYHLARKWAESRCRRAAVEQVTGRHAFATWDQIGDILGMGKQQAEQIGLRALVKIREALLDDPILPSLMEQLRIRTRDHG